MQDTRPFDYSHILDYWNISYQKSHPEIVISGSPQRSSYRIVVEDSNQKMYILERIPEDKVQHKRLICEIVAYLSDQNINGIHSYVRNKDNTFLTRINSSYWQVIPYISNISLNRPEYVFDTWRGTKSAAFLIDLWKNSIEISSVIHLPFFSLKDYVLKMTGNMKTFNPGEYQKILPILSFLITDFFTQYDQVPTRFCHGDYHPLNIIWGPCFLEAVIDWEFLGIKIETYDVANLLGCIGMEEPTSLINDFALTFIQHIKESTLISDIGFSFLFECMLALRFAWLAEWLRAKDREMIDLEIDYLFLLFQQKDEIKKEWNFV
jgi:homoserine kinase type II